MGKIKQVEFFAFTLIPELGGWVAILQQRNDFNAESPTGYKKQSYANAYQPTFCEKAEPGEEDVVTLYRGAKEELGEEAARILMMSEKRLPPPSLCITGLKDRMIDIRAARVESTILKEIRSEVAGRIRLLPRSLIDSIVPLDREKDKGGVRPDIVAMFPDALENLKKAFDWLDRVLAGEDPYSCVKGSE